MKEQISRSVFWMVWSRGAVQVISFVSTILVARLLSPADYGLMALTAIWIYTVSLVAELGLATAILQFRDMDDAELNACFWLSLALGAVGYAGLYAAAPAVAWWFANPRIVSVLRVAGLSLPMLAARLVPDGLLRKRLELHRVAQTDVISALVTIPVVLGLALSGAGVWALVAGAVVMPFAQAATTFWFARWRPGLRLGTRRFREILRYSVGALGSKVGWVVFQQLDTFVLGKIAGAMGTGFYSMGKTLAHLAPDKISVAANQLASPIMAGLQSDTAAMRRSLLRAMRLVGCITAPLCMGLMLVADDVVWLALGPKWMPAVPVVRVLAVCALIRSLDVLFAPVLFARYRTSFMCAWTAGLLLVMPAVFWAGAVWRDGVGVALGWVAVYPLFVAWLANEALAERRRLDLLDRIIRLLLAAASGAVVYGGAIYLSGGSLPGELGEVTSWVVRRPSARPRVVRPFSAIPLSRGEQTL
ncbi:MAG: hypothetical protein DMF78_13050 [Acidobacteria bacterium]|nr:MAG: hypothetical protein DMF78_13050 [Acidobacteriota bacterium]